MFCIRCGQYIPDGAKFCNKCGQTNTRDIKKKPDIFEPSPEKMSIIGSNSVIQTPVMPVSMVQAPVVSVHPIPVQKKKDRRKLIAILSVLAVVVFGVLIIFAFQVTDLFKAKGDMSGLMGNRDESSLASSDESQDASFNTEQSMPDETKADPDILAKQLYVEYLKDTLVPQYGLASEAVFQEPANFNDFYTDIPYSTEQYGIVSYFLDDFDGDSQLDLLLLYIAPYQVSRTDDAESTTDVSHYTGVFVKFFTLEKDQVLEVKSEDPLGYNLMRYVFSHSHNNALQVSLFEMNGQKYLYVFDFSAYQLEPQTNYLRHDFYSFNGLTIERKDAFISFKDMFVDTIHEPYNCDYGQYLYLIQDYDTVGDYYEAFQSSFAKYGINTSWMDEYYGSFVYKKGEYTTSQLYSDNVSNFHKPISDFSKSIITLAVIDTTYTTTDITSAQDTVYSSKITDNSGTKESLGLQSQIGSLYKDYPLPETPVQEATVQDIVKGPRIADSDIENEVLALRAVWNLDRSNIEASKYMKIQVSDNTIAYYNGSEIVMIEIIMGSDASQFGRIYEYSGGNLIFAYVYSPTEENRLYIKNNNLYRWRYNLTSEDASNYDNQWNNQQYLKWEEYALTEGYAILKQARNAM